MKTPFTINHTPWFILGGQVHNSSAYNSHQLNSAWKALEVLHANVAEVPVYWEQVEPEEGLYDFSGLDGLIASARERHINLILLWFATWKNGTMHYVPEWVKTDTQRFPRVHNANGKDLWVLSTFGGATWEADRRAFCSLLNHLRQIDHVEQTVVAVQIENEPGILGSDRDYSPAAELAFNSPVPKSLIQWLHAAPQSPVARAWQQPGGQPKASWSDSFGDHAPEFFTAWSIARYIDQLAEAGKAIYDLPMYVNVWLSEQGWRVPGGYPSGGAVAGVLDIWKWTTPHIDLIAPDIYINHPSSYSAICSTYERADNPLFIPESDPISVANATNLFAAVARFNAVGVAIFGIESILQMDGSPRPEAQTMVESFTCLSAVRPLIERFHSSGRIFAVGQEEFIQDQYFEFEEYIGLVQFIQPDSGLFFDHRQRWMTHEQRGRGLIFEAGPKEFYLVGAGFRLMLQLKGQVETVFSPMQLPYRRVEEGHFSPDGGWVIDRYRNGDEIVSGLWVQPYAGVVRAVLL